MSYSEKSFGARVENAQQLLAHLTSFGDYAPPQNDLSAGSLEYLISVTKQHNTAATGAVQDYSTAVENREKLFRKEVTSLQKLISPISASVKASFGKDSKQANNVITIFRKIKGTKLKKLGKNPDANAISQSEGSYGSQTQSLADIIVILNKYGTKYKPANKNIELPALQKLYENIVLQNKAVTATSGTQTKSRDLRQGKYDQLNEITQRIKEAVKSQYTASSTQYKLIKSLKI